MTFSLGVRSSRITVIIVGGDETVQSVIGVQGFVFGLARTITPHILINYVSDGVIFTRSYS